MGPAQASRAIRASRGCDDRDPFGDGPTTARRIAWGAVILIGCAFSYAIGWQSGWTHAASDADQRLSDITHTMIESRAAAAAAPAAVPAPEPMASSG
jgi:hypothetical protein